MLFSKIIALSNGNLWEKILNWYQNSVIRELLEHFENHVFQFQFGVYDNFNVTSEASKNLKNIILGLTIGMLLAAAMTCYTKAVQGKFVRELIKRECFTPEQAITLRECGFFCHPTIRRELSNGGTLSKVTSRVQTDSDSKASADLLTTRFYIPEEMKYHAEFRYRRKGSRATDLIPVAVLCVLFTWILFKGMPVLLSFADWLISVLS